MKGSHFFKCVALFLSALCSSAYAGPMDGNINSGSGTITQLGTTTSVNQQSQNLVIDWQGFSIGAGEAVNFSQPNTSAIALNRVLGQDASSILGSLTANGQVFILNPNGILFGSTAQVSVGGLVASTLGLSNADFMAGNFSFGKTATAGSIVNQGSLNAANGGYIALLAPEVSNEGVVTATSGTALLGAGDKITLTFNNGSLMSYSIDQGSLNALASNNQLIQANGGQVILSAKAADLLSTAVVNNTGVIEARTIQNVGGVIKLMGDMQVGTVNVGGSLDASAPNGGDGGFIETSAAHVHIANDTQITTTSSTGQAGTWLIDPYDFTIAASGGDITGATLSAALALGPVVIQTTNLAATCTGATCGAGNAAGNGDIFVNDVVTWGANLLTLNAWNNIYINASLQGSGTASLALLYGQGALAAGNTSNYYVHAAVDLPAGPNFSTKLGSDGTVKNFTVITSLGAAGSTTATDLQGMSGNLTVTGNYALGANIDATATSGWNAGAGFAPIGSGTGIGTATQFKGTLDGLGHTISNLVINRPGTGFFVGLFGATGPTFSIRDVGLVGGSVSGLTYIGGLVGYNNGLLYNSYYNGTVSGGTNGNVGGLVGWLNSNVTSIVSSCYASGTVTSSGGINSNAGGLVGITKISSKIENSYSTVAVSGGNFSGGLVGNHGGSVLNNSFSTGSVTGTTAGGLTGTGFGGVTNSFWDTQSSGVATSAKGAGMTTANMMTQANFTAAGWDFTNTWYMVDGATRPFLRSEYSTTISNAHQLQLMALDLAASYALAANINLAESASAAGMWNTTSGFVPVGSLGAPFTGTFDGLTYSISNLTINLPATNYVGLFSYTSAATISNANVSGSVTGFDYVGGIIGKTNALSTVNASSFTGSVTGNAFVGGIVGWNDPSTLNVVYVNGTVSGVSNIGGITGWNDASTIFGASFTGSVSGTDKVGGLTGENSGVSTVSNVVVAGNVGGNTNVGGVIGTNTSTGTLGESYWDTQTSTQANAVGSGASTGTTGLLATQMTQQSSFTGGTGLDFGNTWRIYEGQSVPLLVSFLTPLTITVNNATKTYDGLAYSSGNGYTFSVTPDANLLGSLTYTGSSQGAINAGNYVISVGGFYSNQQGYDITVLDGTLNVGTAALTITGNTANATYNGSVQTNGFTTSTLYGTDSVTGVTGLASGTNAATYTDNLSGAIGSGLSNYTISYANGSLAIDPAALTITGNTANATYNGSVQTNGFTTSTLYGTDSVTGVTGLASGTNAATYTDNLSGAIGSGLSNYTISYANGSLAIDPAALTITANNVSKPYDGFAHSGGNGVTYTGFVNGETAAVLGGTLVYSGTSQGAIDAGNYVITPGGLRSGNYSFSYVDGLLSINSGTPEQVAETRFGEISPTAYASAIATVNIPSEPILLALNTPTNSALVLQHQATAQGKPVTVQAGVITLLNGGIKLPDDSMLLHDEM